MRKILVFTAAVFFLTSSIASGGSIVVPPGAPKEWRERAATMTNWHYDSSYDQMRRQTTYFACTTSNNRLQFDFPYSGGSSGKLCLRESPKYGKDVYLTIEKGQFACSFGGCFVHVKFDDGKVQTYNAVEAADGTTNVVFIRGYAQFQRSLRKAKRLTIEAQYFQEGERQLTFDVHGYSGVY